MEIRQWQIGYGRPELSICLSLTHDFLDRFDQYERFLVEIDHPGVELVAAVLEENGVWDEGILKNGAVDAATADKVAITSSGTYPTASLMVATQQELATRPTAVVLARRLDGLPNHSFMPNPYCLGDWVCCTKETFDMLGRYHTDWISGAAYYEDSMIARAVAQDRLVVMLDEKIVHGWHAERLDRPGYQEDSEKNRQQILDKVGFHVVFHYPDVGYMVDAAGNVLSAWSPTPQTNAVTVVTPHSPHDKRYWQFIHEDKRKRLGMTDV